MAEAKKKYINPRRFKSINEDELQELKVVRRKEIAQKIKRSKRTG